jgi:hypothetical protein
MGRLEKLGSSVARLRPYNSRKGDPVDDNPGGQKTAEGIEPDKGLVTKQFDLQVIV